VSEKRYTKIRLNTCSLKRPESTNVDADNDDDSDDGNDDDDEETLP
jgi:hypothetical protein